MTTTVKRGAGRPAATANSNRHAQRTPLPPRPETIQDAKDAIAEAAKSGEATRAARAGARRRPKASAEAVAANIAELEAEQVKATVTEADTSGAFRYGRKSVAELRARAEELGLEPPKRVTKPKLIEAIVSKERADLAEAKVDAALAPDPLDAALDAAFSEPTPGTWAADVKERLDTKSGAKAEAFATEALRLGWKAEGELLSEDRATVTATRGDERIMISWIGGVFIGDTCYYSHNGRTPIKLHNASAAKKRMAVPPAQADEEATKVTAHKATRAKASAPASAKRSGRKLPFTEASLDQEVLDALYGKRIYWTNTISGAEEDDRVPAEAETVRLGDGSPGKRKQHHAPRITEGPKGRIINFVGAAGFRSVLLASITRVR
jgi:hypothetical protein